MSYLSLIYRQNGMWLSKRHLSWQEWQIIYPDYISSLDNWSCEDLTDFLQEEYPDLSPDAATQIAFALNNNTDYLLTFKKSSPQQESNL
ncbi:MAG TPA: hypothetical protein PLN40_06780 [Agitococcus sp.]|nr:hypothetical protein [Agitococcus sp.]